MHVSHRAAWFALALFVPFAAQAALDPPWRALSSDSGSVRLDKGVEFLRVTEYAAARRTILASWTAGALARWRTDWLMPEGDGDRIRQDGRWYAGLSRPLLRPVQVWASASGEHFDDRPVPVRTGRVAGSDIAPRSPALETSPSFAPMQSANAVRILRAGAGFTAKPWKPLIVDVAAGPVQDRRIGQVRSGVGVWSRAAVEHWDLGGYDQSLTLTYNRENPKNHNSEDLIGSCRIERTFFEGATNRAEMSGSLLGRDVYLAGTDRTARRDERSYVVRDALTYGVARGVGAELSGEITHQRTDQSQNDAGTSSLEENQAGFAAALDGSRGHHRGRVQIAVRQVTQTIRGDILQGRKTDLELRGRTLPLSRAPLSVRLAVSKYTLDTRSTDNYDDRDELRYAAEASWMLPLIPTVSYELYGVCRFDHLVYIFRQSSANNRWTRFFLAGSSIRHRAGRAFDHTVRLSVSANYQDFDFDTDPRTARSTVYRRLQLADSAVFAAGADLSVRAKLGWQMEEFGRLFWDSFEEERSDETHSLSASLECLLRLPWGVQAGAGALWDSRRGERFPVSPGAPKVVFQDLESYGPLISLERSASRGLFVSLNGRSLRQLQLDKEDRWIVMGEMIGGFRW